MPITPTYPGVYVEEIASGVRTITGVATSITAFVGRALRGPVNEPISINSYGDFERIFGGLWLGSSLGYAVRDFFLNGGSQAIIVRLVHKPLKDDTSKSIPATKARLDVNGLNLEAVSQGTWGNSLRARIDHKVKTDDPADTSNVFNLVIYDGMTGQVEMIRNVSVLADHPRQVDKVLLNESSFVRVNGTLPTATPSAHPDPQPKQNLWGDPDPKKPEQQPTNTKVADSEKGTDGSLLDENDFTGTGKEGAKEGLFALKKADIFNILCIPPYKEDHNVDSDLVDEAIAFCQAHRAFFIIDSPSGWTDKDTAIKAIDSPPDVNNPIGSPSNYAGIFFPRLRQSNPLRQNQIEDFAPCGAIAGIFARTDAERGVWKAPAGLDATLVGVPQLSVPLTDAENGELNPHGINCLRTLPAAGRVVWGSRTRRGDDRLADEWKYIPVRRTALFIEESLYRGTQWVVFEPNDEPLWSQIRLNVGAFMQNLFRQGAFQGKTPTEAYFVKCDKETTIQNDINLGIVNVVVGFAPLKPAEFVILKIQQIAGQIAV